MVISTAGAGSGMEEVLKDLKQGARGIGESVEGDTLGGNDSVMKAISSAFRAHDPILYLVGRTPATTRQFGRSPH